jgi:FKBP-type peptidyl-prolyl cis-trans isomerase FkpA
MNQTILRGLTAALSCIAAGLALGQTASTAGAASAASAASPAPKAASPMSEDQKTLYTLGVLLSRNLDSFALTDAEFATVRQGFADGYHHKPATKDAESSLPQVQALQRARSQQVAMAYLDKAAKAPGATKTASGLVYIPVKEGSGASPLRSDKVKVTYEGRLTDGTVFDSSAQHGGATTFPLTGVIACWTEALQRMKVGAKSRIVCTSQIAYGERGVPPKIRPGSTLEFDIELLEIEPAPTPAPGSAAAPSSSSGAGAIASPP